jgi:hypothetical protein
MGMKLACRGHADNQAPAPQAAGAALVWNDAAYAPKRTGRLPLSGDERSGLGPLAERFPVFG